MSKTNGNADETHVGDKLIKVPQYSLVKFRNMFKANWPMHITGKHDLAYSATSAVFKTVFEIIAI